MNHLRARRRRYCIAGWIHGQDGRKSAETLGENDDEFSMNGRMDVSHPKPRMMNLAGHVVPTWAAPPETYAIKPSHKPFPMASAVESLTFVCSESSCGVMDRDVQCLDAPKT
jgi:hypothetical protein